MKHFCGHLNLSRSFIAVVVKYTGEETLVLSKHRRRHEMGNWKSYQANKIGRSDDSDDEDDDDDSDDDDSDDDDSDDDDSDNDAADDDSNFNRFSKKQTEEDPDEL